MNKIVFICIFIFILLYSIISYFIIKNIQNIQNIQKNQQLTIVFSNADALREDPLWSDYFETVYGIDTMSFPFSMLPLNFFYVHLLPASVKLDIRIQDISHNNLLPTDGRGPLVAGDLYRLWGGDKPPDISDMDIWRCIYPVGQPLDKHGMGNINFELEHGFPSGTKIEVMHRHGDPAGGGMWFYYSAGSGIYFALGKTVTFMDHSDAASAWGVSDDSDLRALANAAIARGYDSIQYTHRKESIYKFEIVAVRLDGEAGCFAPTASNLFSQGWGGVNPCSCKPGDTINCLLLSQDDMQFNSTGVLPVFHDLQQLRKSVFYRYLQKVYTIKGFQPTVHDFPLYLSTFDVFYLPLLREVGLNPPMTNVSGCKAPDGALYLNMSGNHDPPGTVWVWRSIPQAVTTRENSWVEVTHCADKEATVNEHTVMWCYIARGSGNFANIGKTVSFAEHRDAAKHFLNKDCDEECVDLFDRIFAAARAQKYDSIQFTKHPDQTCGLRAIELVLLGVGSGADACPNRLSTFASGWLHSQPCLCEPTKECLRC